MTRDESRKLGSKTNRITSPDFSTSIPMMVKECPRDRQIARSGWKESNSKSAQQLTGMLPVYRWQRSLSDFGCWVKNARLEVGLTLLEERGCGFAGFLNFETLGITTVSWRRRGRGGGGGGGPRGGGGGGGGGRGE